MTEITINAILSQVEKSTATQTGVPALPKPSETILNGTQPAPSSALNATPCSKAQQRAELQRSDHSHTRSSCAKEGGYDEKLATDKQRAARAGRTRARNRTGKLSHAHSDSESIGVGPSTFESEANNGALTSGRDPSWSPTPIATADEPEAQTTHTDFSERLIRRFHDILDGSGMQTLIEVKGTLSADPTYTIQPQEQSVEAQFLPPIVVGAGGGFHLDHPAHPTLETPLPAHKRPAMTIHSNVGGKVYNGHLNIVEINSQRVSATTIPSQQGSCRRTAPSQTQPRQKGKGATSADNRASPASQRTGNDNFDLLDSLDEDQLVVDSARWVNACFVEVAKDKWPNVDLMTLTMSADMLTVILNNLCNAHYRDLLQLRDPVRVYYNLKNPRTSEERQDNEDKVGGVHPNWFHYKNLEKPVDPYEGEILALFKRSNDPKDEQNHLAVLAYLATMVQFCLSEWTEGFFKQGTLNATTQYSVWLCHFDGLKKVSLKARKRLGDTYDLWVQKKFAKKHYVQAVISLEDVCPDSPPRSPSPNNQD
ncbi:hypothetical protein FRC11_007365 [Ceratobasidium sp. 423]|nr:hypothetical protein FRC11_007365 [Ceratobasidium sp. 423]